MARTAERDRVVIGVDFGTTFSGVASVYTGAPEAADDISVIKMWPGANGITSDKVPSVLAYTSGGVTPQVYWGFEESPNSVRLSCLKLLLDPMMELPPHVSRNDLLHQLEDAGKEPQDAVADYLTRVYAHARDSLVKRYGQVFVNATTIEVVMTVPAVWSDAAKDATLKAAQKAGMGTDLRLISEPEAAAVYTLKAIQPNHLRAGDNFVVCDAGGGTVDLISYRIVSTDPLRLEESVEGTGALCGAVFLNLAFERYVRKKLGAHKFRVLRTTKPRCWPAAAKYFEENVKRTFNPQGQGEITIPLPGAPDDRAAGIEDGFLIMKSSDIAGIFNPIVCKVITLIEAQVNALQSSGESVNGIILVGGFGQSNYLYHRVRNHFVGPPPPYTELASAISPLSSRLEVMQPSNAWTAVVRGAVLRGAEGVEIVHSRKARRHYGTGLAIAYCPDRHSEDDKYWDDLKEEWKVRGYEWYIKKGETVSSDGPVSFGFHTRIRDGQPKKAGASLYVSDTAHAPEYEGSPYGEDVRKLCRLSVDLSGVLSRRWIPGVTSDGVKFSKVSYDVGMKIESGGLRFDLRVGGIVYGEMMATFE